MNSRFFHAMARSRAATTSVVCISNDRGEMFHGIEAIQEISIDHFWRLLTSYDHEIDEGLIELIPCIVSAEDNDVLLQPFSMEEMHEVIVSIPSNTAPGMDDFTSAFFASSWEMVKLDVLAAIIELLGMGSFPLYLIHTIIALIPEKELESGIFLSHQIVPDSLQNLCKACGKTAL